MNRIVMLTAVGMMALTAQAQAQQSQNGSSNGTAPSNSRNWVRIADYDENVYVDLNSVLKRNQKAVFDILKNYDKVQTTGNGKKYKSIVRSWQFDCKKQVARDVNVEVHPDEMGKGQFYQAAASEEFTPFDLSAPKTEADTIAYFACGRPGNYDYMSQSSDPKLFQMCDHRKLTLVSKDSVRSEEKKLLLEVDSNNLENINQNKYTEYSLSAIRPGFKLNFATPEGMKGPYDASGNKIKGPVSFSVGPVDMGEIVLKGAISKTAVIFQQVAFSRTLRPDLLTSAWDPESVANGFLRKYGFDICRAIKTSNIQTVSGATILTYKSSGNSVFNGVENDEDKKDRVSMIVTSIALPGGAAGYSFITAIVESDVKAYDANPQKYDEMAMRYFMSMFSKHSVEYKPTNNK